jgi:hypothetical protein
MPARAKRTWRSAIVKSQGVAHPRAMLEALIPRVVAGSEGKQL